MLMVQNLSLSFDNTSIFSDVSFAVEQGEIACLLGRSGCGKTSMLRCLLGLNTPKQGSICMNNQVLCDTKQGINVSPHKRGIGMVFQDYGLFAHLTVAQNIAFGLAKNSSQRVDELLALIQMQAFAKRYPHELSGGQQQRVALARTIAPAPKFVLLDEPFSNLDVALRQTLSYEIVTLLKSQHIGAILVTHDQSEAFAMADKVGVMAEGKLCQWDTPMGLYQYPNNALVAEFIGEGTLLDIDQTTLTGEVGGYAKTALGLVFCDNLTAAHQKLLLRPAAVVVDTDDPKKSLSVGHKKFVEGRWLYTLIKDGDPSVAIKVFDERCFAIGTRLCVTLKKGWAL